MKNLLVALFLSLSAISCAHHETAREEASLEHPQASSLPAADQKAGQKIAFDGHCANSVCHDDMKVMGKKEYSMDYEGQTYYFSSAKARDKFKVDLLKNISSARKNWGARSGRVQ